MSFLVNSFSRMFFDIIQGENSFIGASLHTLNRNYSILDYFKLFFILELNPEFRDFKLLLKRFVLEILME